uniref:YHYH protein n=1 Tax=Acinetobacter baumannii TaxID=470 RepID=UPI001CBEB767
GYGQVANPKALRVALNDNLSAAGLEPSTKTHSPILGFAYDGNPIYGPFAHQNPLDSQSPIVRMTSSYVRNSSRSGGPSVSEYPLGTFTNDYTYKHKNGSLDENNGRFCITPEFPEGVYAYFLTIDSNQVPQYPYILGENFYSLPVDSNYNSDINQNDIPKASRRLFTPGMQGNG